MLNFKSFHATGSVFAGIELLHMIRKGEFATDGADAMPVVDHFLSWQEWPSSLSVAVPFQG